MPIDDVPWQLVERYSAGSCTPDERAALDAWIGDDPTRRLLVERLAAMFGDRSAPPSDADVERAWHELAAKMRDVDSAERSMLWSVGLILAVLVALLGAAWALVHHGW